MSGGMFDMSDRVAVITGAGANGGVGHALALGFARQGADIVAADIDTAGAEVTADEVRALGRRSIAVHCDISRDDDVVHLFEEVDSQFGRVDILVNVPYVFPERVQPHELTLAGWQKTLDVCITGYFLCARQAVRRMLSQGAGGSILNISSIAGSSALGRGNFPYSVAKGGVNQLTKELAVEYAGKGIRVNAIQPCTVLTPGLKTQLLADPRFGQRLRDRLLVGIPMNRFMDPEDMVGPGIFLCSDAAAAVTGVLLPVDGGNLALNASGSHIWPSE
ncbi:MAG: SDR family oxidoreductase [Anaerolineae bacterium]|nr:SDR family oxidoreductase [Anaerolineae bacterium]